MGVELDSHHQKNTLFDAHQPYIWPSLKVPLLIILILQSMKDEVEKSNI